MKSRQVKRLISFLETGKINRENISIISMVPGMLRFAKELDGIILQILERMYKQAESIGHYSEDKNETRKALAEHAALLSGMAYAYGLDVKSYEISCSFKWSYTSLFRKRDSGLIASCNYIHKKLSEHQEILKEYGIKKKDIALLDELGKRFAKLYTKPGVAIGFRSVQTEALGREMDAASDLLYEKMDKMLPCFRQYPEFCKAYKQSRKQQTYPQPEVVLEKTIKDFYLAPQVPVSRRKKKVTEVLELEAQTSEGETKTLPGELKIENLEMIPR